MIIDNPTSLNEWLINYLEPMYVICDYLSFHTIEYSKFIDFFHSILKF